MGIVLNKLPSNEVVTRAVNGYVQSSYIGSQILPIVEVDKEKADIYEFGSENFKLYETARPMKADIQTADVDDWTVTTIELEEHSFGFNLDQREIANGGTVMSVLKEYGKRAAQSLELDREKSVADLVFNPAVITAGTALTSTDKWSDVDSSNPIGDIQTGIDTVRGSTGQDANTLVLGDAVYKALRSNEQIIEYLKHTGQVLTIEALAKILDVPKILVGKAVYMLPNKTMANVWTDSALICYTPNAPSVSVPALGYQYQLKGSKRGLSYPANTSGTVTTVAATDTYKEKVVWANAGYLIEDIT